MIFSRRHSFTLYFLFSFGICVLGLAGGCSKESNGGKSTQADASSFFSDDARSHHKDELSLIARSSEDSYRFKEIAEEVKTLNEQEVQLLESLLSSLAQTTDLQKAYSIAEKIEEFGPAAIPVLKKSLSKDLALSPRIALYSVFYNLGEWDYAVEGLAEIARQDNPLESRLAAAELLSVFASPRHEEFLEKTLDEVFLTPVRIELALVLWQNTKSSRAKKELFDLLESESENYRMQAALALGRIGDLTRSRKILEIMADEPTLRGKLADAILEREVLLRELEGIILSDDQQNKKGKTKINTSILDKVARMIQERYIYADRAKTKRLFLAAAAGLLNSIDSYALYFEPERVKELEKLKDFYIPSLGIYIGAQDFRKGNHFRVPTIISVELGSPADLAGLVPGDKILSLAPNASFERILEWRKGSPRESHEVVEGFIQEPLYKQLELLKGIEGTSSGLLISRKDWLLSRWVHLVHKAPNDFHKKIYSEITPKEYAYIQLPVFQTHMISELQAILKKIKAQEVKGLVLDLRNNANGSVEVASKVAGLFLSKNSLVTYSSGRSEELGALKEYRTDEAPLLPDLPLVALIDKGTSDSAEIFAAALQDHKRALIVGSKSFGRAIVQEVIPFEAKPPQAAGLQDSQESKNYALFIKTAQYFTPLTKRKLYEQGVMPDRLVETESFQGWVYDELDLLRASGVIEDYLKVLFSKHKDQVIKCIQEKDAQLSDYPGWQEVSQKLPDNNLEEQHLLWFLKRSCKLFALKKGLIENHKDLSSDPVFFKALEELKAQS